MRSLTATIAVLVFFCTCYVHTANASFDEDHSGPVMELSRTMYENSIPQGKLHSGQVYFFIRNVGAGVLDWSIGYVDTPGNHEYPDWFSFDPESGSVNAGEQQSVRFTIHYHLMDVGTHECRIHFVAPGAEIISSDLTVAIELYGPRLTYNPDKILLYTDSNRKKDLSTVFQLGNIGGGEMKWSLDMTQTAQWLSLEPAGGELGWHHHIDIDVLAQIEDFSVGRYETSFALLVPDVEPNRIDVPVKVIIDGSLFVDDDAPGDPGPRDPLVSDPQEDGTYNHPFDSIQEAIDSAGFGDIVIISDGLYAGAGNRDIVWQGKSITVRSENGPEKCIIDCGGSEQDPHRGFTIYVPAHEESCLLEGVTIINGWIDHLGGAGIYCQGTDTYSRGPNPVIRNCVIQHNTCASSEGGGGIHIDNCRRPLLQGCDVSYNYSVGSGGGVRSARYGGGTIRDCIVSYNTTEEDGGGIMDWGWGLIENCRVAGNTAGRNGGGCAHCYGYYYNCVVVGNEALDRGGGIYHTYGSLTNCTIANNKADIGGGYGCIGYGYPINDVDVSNSILWGNEANEGPQIAILSYLVGYFESCQCWVKAYTILRGDNSILQGGIDDIYIEDHPENYIEYLHHLDVDPLFVVEGYWDQNETPQDKDDDIWIDGDYHLKSQAGRWDEAAGRWTRDDITSPGIDAGDPNYVTGPDKTDLDGNPRVVDGDSDGNAVVDMGAYEFLPPDQGDLLYVLAADVIDFVQHEGIENSLLVKLDTALQKLEDDNENNDVAAVNSLQAFINAVKTQRGKKISEDAADDLIETAQQIIDMLSGA